ncbi:SDR family NAD(P)-dependent oxidoreductase [Chryseosolibacter indicus]|uniref:SDR family NAD(P)-dependent oxidoreductase n=1 Tax=Chryseosolibacter indicus TaxID=2782351 RepID=A0ABS5VTJ0_9BACT|nr:SDR family NAD(P)-dependent oxidoreductase [Chryseosolibacter indicus]MBT1704089.1 SDR family NAD(P)-dependent oxidoreductase [Chryseosolibacter indicus]
MSTKKVWFVTGASKGLGLTLVKRLLNEGYRVAATSRTAEALKKEVGSSTNFLALKTDVANEKSVQDAIAKTLATFGGIDVVVNNAGYGQLGTLEESTDKEARENFDANVFGLLNVIRNVMPHMRNKKSGHIINISSIAGFLGAFPGWGIYNATKFAVAGLTEALSAEAKSLGIAATIVYPGYFKTNFLLKGSLRFAQNPIAEYKEARELDRAHVEDIPGNQPGDPEKAALAFIQLAEQKNPPLHLFMGSDSIGMANNKLEILKGEISAHDALSRSTDFLK